MYRQATHREIRSSLGHGEGNRRVRISQDGRVTYYGSTTDIDRSQDWWHEGGYVTDYKVDDDGQVVG
jgi:hypothetical protein